MNLRTLTVAAVAVGATLLTAACGTSGQLDTSSPATHSPSHAPSSSAPSVQPAPPVTDTPSEDTSKPLSLHPRDFILATKIKRKACFGSAGCNVTVGIKLTYLGDTPLTGSDSSYDLTYKVTGDEDGPQIDTLTLNNDGSYNYDETMLSTPSATTRIRAWVTEVEPTP